MNADSPLRRLLPLALAAGLLYVASLAVTRLPCWGLFALLVPLAWLLWAYWAGNALFARRLWLTGVTRTQSGLRRWLVRGWLVQALATVPALLFAAVLLALAALLGPEHWLLLALDVLLLSLAIGPLQRWLGTQVQADKVGTVARRWPLMLLNLALLGVTFLVLDFAVLGGPDSRGQAWHFVAEAAFRDASAAAACTAAGWGLGALAAVDALAWHASLLVIPSLPEPVLRLAAWGLVLLQAGVFAWLFTSLLLGALALVEQRRAATTGDGPGVSSTVSTAFIYTILLLALPYLYAAHKLRQFDPASLAEQAQAVVAWTNPCRADPALAALSDELDARLGAARTDALASADAAIATALDDFFARAEHGVDAYLDWYFTVVGEYQRLAAVAVGDMGAFMAAQLDQRLFADTGLEAWLDATFATLDADAVARLAGLAGSLGARLGSAAEQNDCTVELLGPAGLAGVFADPAALGRDLGRAGTAAAAGALTTKLVSKQVAGAVAAKLGATQSFKTAVALAGKAAAKKGGASVASALGATALCAPSGPWALLCGIGAGAAAWLAVDKAMIEIDEVRFREAMRADLLAVLAEQRAALKVLLRTRQVASIDARLGALAERLGRRYVPARESGRLP